MATSVLVCPVVIVIVFGLVCGNSMGGNVVTSGVYVSVNVQLGLACLPSSSLWLHR